MSVERNTDSDIWALLCYFLYPGVDRVMDCDHYWVLTNGGDGPIYPTAHNCMLVKTTHESADRPTVPCLKRIPARPKSGQGLLILISWF